jgi:predicted dehydrogenase
MALTLAGAEEIERERVRSGKVVMVGTMRRYATAFLRVKEIIEREEGIAYGRCCTREGEEGGGAVGRGAVKGQ